MKPPTAWVRAGLCEADDFLIVEGAMYGLKDAPLAWGLTRDADLRAVTWTWNGQLCWLQQGVSDTNVWTIMTLENAIFASSSTTTTGLDHTTSTSTSTTTDGLGQTTSTSPSTTTDLEWKSSDEEDQPEQKRPRVRRQCRGRCQNIRSDGLRER